MDDQTFARQEWWPSGDEPDARIVVLETEDGNLLGRCPVNSERWMWLVLRGETMPAECDDRCSEWKHLDFMVDGPLFLPAGGIDLVPYVDALPDDVEMGKAAAERLAALPDAQFTLRGKVVGDA